MKCCNVDWGNEVLRCLHCNKTLDKVVKVQSMNFPQRKKYIRVGVKNS